MVNDGKKIGKQLSWALISSSNISTADSDLGGSRALTSSPAQGVCVCTCYIMIVKHVHHQQKEGILKDKLGHCGPLWDKDLFSG